MTHADAGLGILALQGDALRDMRAQTRGPVGQQLLQWREKRQRLRHRLGQGGAAWQGGPGRVCVQAQRANHLHEHLDVHIVQHRPDAARRVAIARNQRRQPQL